MKESRAHRDNTVGPTKLKSNPKLNNPTKSLKPLHPDFSHVFIPHPKAMNDQHTLKAALEQKFGLRNIRPEWLRRQTELSVNEVVGPICRSDLCQITTGTLPWNLSDAHSVQLDTKALVQIDDVINIANSDPRSSDAPRVLQLTLTDGRLDFVAVELEPLRRLSMTTVPGTKMVLHPTALVRRGRLFLTGKDFTFLGFPASNPSSNIVWGGTHAQKIDTALREAGLPNPKASTFDTIARDNGQLLPDMGGIADAARIAGGEQEDADDEDFWAHAVAVAESNEAAAGMGVRLGMNRANGNAVARERSSATTLRNGAPAALLGRDATIHVESTQHSRDAQAIPAIAAAQSSNAEHAVSGAPESTPQAVEIPDMPVFESDCLAFGSDSDFESLANDVEMGKLQQADGEVDDCVVPVLKRPFCRLEDVEATKGQHARKLIVCRAYVPKLRRKPKAVQYDGGFIFSIPFDDGSRLCKLGIRNTFFGDLTNVVAEGLMGSSEGNSIESGISNPFLDSPVAYADTILGYSRAIHGFIQIECVDDTAIVTNVSQQPPEGLVGIPISSDIARNVGPFYIPSLTTPLMLATLFVIVTLDRSPHLCISQNCSKHVSSNSLTTLKLD